MSKFEYGPMYNSDLRHKAVAGGAGMAALLLAGTLAGCSVETRPALAPAEAARVSPEIADDAAAEILFQQQGRRVAQIVLDSFDKRDTNYRFDSEGLAIEQRPEPGRQESTASMIHYSPSDGMLHGNVTKVDNTTATHLDFLSFTLSVGDRTTIDQKITAGERPTWSDLQAIVQAVGDTSFTHFYRGGVRHGESFCVARTGARGLAASNDPNLMGPGYCDGEVIEQQDAGKIFSDTENHIQAIRDTLNE